MAEPSGAQKFFEAAVSVIESEADGFAGVLDTMVSFDVVGQCESDRKGCELHRRSDGQGG